MREQRVGGASTQTNHESPTARPAAPERALTFRVGGQVFALPLDVVIEIQQLVEFTPLPAADPEVLGLLDVRGTVMPAYDLGQILGLGMVVRTLETPMLICRLRTGTACLVVDGVCDVVELGSGLVQSPGEPRGSVEGMLGACRIGDDLVVVLDPQRLIPDRLDSTVAAMAPSSDQQAPSADLAAPGKGRP